MQIINDILFNLKRISFDIILWLLLIIIYAFDVSALTPALQLLFFKTLLVSMAFIHAHILRKLAFGTVKWENGEEDKFKKILIISLYVIIIYAYAKGG